MLVGSVTPSPSVVAASQAGQGAARGEENKEKALGVGKKSEKDAELGTDSQVVKALTEEEQKKVEVLKKADREVRTHEAAHVAAGGEIVRGGASLQYAKGPDGKRYAVAGEVSIDTSPVSGDPEATARKAETIRRAALAPANPSSQDRKVAAEASQMATRARFEMAKQGGEESVDREDAASVEKNNGVTSYQEYSENANSRTGSEIDLVA